MTDPHPSAAARSEAVLAVGLLLVGLAVGILALVHGPLWRLAVAALAVVVAVSGAWYLLSHRGAMRATGLVAAAAGVAGLLAVVLTAEFRGLALVGTLLLMVASSACAGLALRDRGQPAAGEGRAAPPLPPPRHPALIMNPKSGGGKAVRYGLADACRARGIEVIELTAGDDLATLAAEAIGRGADAIGMAGGDGSQALVASVASEHDVPFVCVPAGTRNHLALDLGIDRDDVVGALDAFSGGLEARVDLATVNGRVFVNNASMGLYAKIVQSDAYRDAKVKTAADMLPELLGPDTRPFDLRFCTPSGTTWRYAHMLLVSNNPYRLDHLMGGGTRPRMDTGTLGVAAARIDGPAAAAALVGLEAAGRLRSFDGWEEWAAPAFRVDSTEPIEIGIDGEATVMDPPLVFESRPAALRVRLPGEPAGRRAAVERPHLDRSTVRSLLRIAAGRPAVEPSRHGGGGPDAPPADRAA